jgi:hypothetical protein
MHADIHDFIVGVQVPGRQDFPVTRGAEGDKKRRKFLGRTSLEMRC